MVTSLRPVCHLLPGSLATYLTYRVDRIDLSFFKVPLSSALLPIFFGRVPLLKTRLQKKRSTLIRTSQIGGQYNFSWFSILHPCRFQLVWAGGSPVVPFADSSRGTFQFHSFQGSESFQEAIQKRRGKQIRCLKRTMVEKNGEGFFTPRSRQDLGKWPGTGEDTGQRINSLPEFMNFSHFLGLDHFSGKYESLGPCFGPSTQQAESTPRKFTACFRDLWGLAGLLPLLSGPCPKESLGGLAGGRGVLGGNTAPVWYGLAAQAANRWVPEVFWF